jgi:hypothetical protein
MSNLSLAQLNRERKQLLEELSTLSQLLHGSWIERFSTCARKECKCHQGQRHGPRHYLVINEGGKQYQKYIPNSHVATAQAGLKQYKRLQEIVDRITRLNLMIIKEEAASEDQ